MNSLHEDIRLTIYSYLDLMSLIRKASRVSKYDSKLLLSSKILT